MFTFKQWLPKEIKCISVLFFVPIGLFNISDKLLVSLDILLEWREEFKRGVPPTVAVESKLATLIKKTAKVCKTINF